MIASYFVKDPSQVDLPLKLQRNGDLHDFH